MVDDDHKHACQISAYIELIQWLYGSCCIFHTITLSYDKGGNWNWEVLNSSRLPSTHMSIA